MSLLIFGHIDTRHHRLVIEEELGQGLGQFGFTYTRGTEEEEGAQRPVFVGQSRTASAHGIGHGTDCLVLSDYPLMQRLFHMEQLGSFTLKHPSDRDTRPAGNHLRNIFRSNGLGDDRVLDFSLLGLELFHPVLELGHLAVSQLRHFAVVAFPFGNLGLLTRFLDLLAAALQLGKNGVLVFPTLTQFGALVLEFLELIVYFLQLQGSAFAFDSFLLDFQLADTAVQLGNRLRYGIHLQTQLGRRLIHKVNGLVRQETVVDVAVGEVDCRNQRIVFDTHLVVVLILLLQSTQYGNGLCRRRLVHHHLLETALEGLVLLEIFLKFIQSG